MRKLWAVAKDAEHMNRHKPRQEFFKPLLMDKTAVKPPLRKSKPMSGM
jgi:hypothetical protein